MIKKITTYLMVILVLLTLCGCSEANTAITTSNTHENVTGRLIVTYLDVGQADCILIQEATGKNMLIDAGNNGDADYILNYLNSKAKIEKIDYLIGTHPHEDHIGSLDKVIENFDIGNIIMPKVSSSTKTFEDVLNSIKSKGLSIETPIPGNTFNLGEAKCTILSPLSSKYKEINNYSISIKVEYGETSFLFTGDAEKESEKEMINKWGNNLNSNVLKVGHHGSSSSSTNEFLNKVKPNIAVISVGKDNDYNHPHKEIIDRFVEHNITVLRTDEIGDIIISSDGKNIYKEDEPIVSDYNSDNIKNNNIDENAEEPTLSNIIIENIDKVGELVTLRNNETIDIDISNWLMISVTGKDSQTFTFPEGTIIKANDILTLASGEAIGDIKLTKSNIWSNSKSDPGELYNNNSKLISRWDD